MGVALDYDAIVIGAGVSGLYQLHSLREAGLTARVLERGSAVGGTWYWNRYPGCRFDSESYTYGYSFSKELLEEWSWQERFAPQPETERYLNHVADRFDLRRDIQFDTEVVAAHFDDDAAVWQVTTGAGETLVASYLITAVGFLTVPTLPRIPGRDTFAGPAFHTARWPADPVEIAGKRIAVIGTGATGVQLITEVAKTAGHLTVYQRRPNWCAPLHNSPIPSKEMAQIKREYPAIFERCMQTFNCFIHDMDPRFAASLPAEEREARFQELWDTPGFGIWQGNFRDVLVDPEANRMMSEFAARKIRERVIDPAVAEKLIPTDHGFGTRRVPLESGYYEVFNQDNVKLIDTGATPIEEITPRGIRSGDGERAFDMIVYATGFDAVTGAYDAIDIRGAGGQSLREKWRGDPQTLFGTLVDGFPNLFMVMGPQVSIGNFPRAAEYNIRWIMALIAEARRRGATRIEVSPEAVQAWVEGIRRMGERSLTAQVRSWFTGINTNIDGRDRPRALLYGNSHPAFRQACDAVAEGGYREINFA